MLVLTSRDVWAAVTPYAVGGRWYESYAAGTGLGLTGSTTTRDRWNGETRSDLDWCPQCRKRRISREAAETKGSKQTRFCGE